MGDTVFGRSVYWSRSVGRKEGRLDWKSLITQVCPLHTNTLYINIFPLLINYLATNGINLDRLAAWIRVGS